MHQLIRRNALRVKQIIFLFVFLLTSSVSFAQLDLRKVMGAALEGDMQLVLNTVETTSGQKLSAKDSSVKARFEERFKYETDRSSFLADRKSKIDSLLLIYHEYWRKSLLDNTKKYDDDLRVNLSSFLSTHYAAVSNLNAASTDEAIDESLTGYIKSIGLHTTGYGNTGKFKDLLVWETEKDTTYNFSIGKEKISAHVILMDKFITLGWEEFATLDKLHPGGWATPEALYCVAKGYDLKSETFLVSYLAHEGRHFSDYKVFPKLTSADLEFRAKLTELSMAKATLFTLIEFFIINANYESENGHQVANYCAIRDISRILFKTDMEKDMEKWKKLSVNTIQAAAKKALDANTASLKKVGKDVGKFIKQ